MLKNYFIQRFTFAIVAIFALLFATNVVNAVLVAKPIPVQLNHQKQVTIAKTSTPSSMQVNLPKVDIYHNADARIHYAHYLESKAASTLGQEKIDYEIEVSYSCQNVACAVITWDFDGQSYAQTVHFHKKMLTEGTRDSVPVARPELRSINNQSDYDTAPSEDFGVGSAEANDDIERVKNEYNDVKRKLDRLISKNGRQRDEIETKNRKLKEKHNRYQADQNKIGALNKQIHRSNRQLEQVRTRLAEKENTHNQIVSTHNDSVERSNTAASRLHQLLQQAANNTTALERLEQKKNQLVNEEQDFKRKLATANQEITDLLHGIDKSLSTLKASQNQLRKVQESAVNRSNAAISSHNKNLENINQHAKVQQGIDSIETDFGITNDPLFNIEHNLDALLKDASDDAGLFTSPDEDTGKRIRTLLHNIDAFKPANDNEKIQKSYAKKITLQSDRHAINGNHRMAKRFLDRATVLLDYLIESRQVAVYSNQRFSTAAVDVFGIRPNADTYQGYQIVQIGNTMAPSLQPGTIATTLAVSGVVQLNKSVSSANTNFLSFNDNLDVLYDIRDLVLEGTSEIARFLVSKPAKDFVAGFALGGLEGVAGLSELVGLTHLGDIPANTGNSRNAALQTGRALGLIWVARAQLYFALPVGNAVGHGVAVAFDATGPGAAVGVPLHAVTILASGAVGVNATLALAKGTALLGKTDDHLWFSKGETPGKGGGNQSDPNPSSNPNAKDSLIRKLKGLEKAQQKAHKTVELPDGRIRYYGKEVPARTKGPTRGGAHVTEYNPKTGQVKDWRESYDHSGNVIRVHPKSNNGQVLDAPHFPPTGKELGKK